MNTDLNTVTQAIADGKTTIGIELGSSRIKTVLIGPDNFPIASGSFDWENSNINGIWTYDLDDVWKGVQTSYRNMAENVQSQYGITLTTTGAIGFSAMMHGYIVLDKSGKQLVPFRTWRNNITGKASETLTELFNYPIPQRWSVAHLYQAILNGENHVSDIDYLTTLAGYVHWKLTGRRVMGIGEASGMFPIDLGTKRFNAKFAEMFDQQVSASGFPWKLAQILPEVLISGDSAGELTAEGARLARSDRQFTAGNPLLSARGRRRYGHGGDQQCRSPNRQCFSRNISFCDDRPGKGFVQGLSRNRPGDDTGRQPGRHGSFQQLHLGL